MPVGFIIGIPSSRASMADPYPALGTMLVDLRSYRGITAPSGVVAGWADFAGPSFADFAQSTAGSRFAYVTSGTPRGRPSLRGTNRYLIGPSGLFPSTFTIFLVGRRTGAGAFQCFFNGSNRTDWNNNVGLGFAANGTTLIAWVGSYASTRVTWESDTNWHVFTMTFNGTTLELFVDGVSKGTASCTLTAGGPLILGAGIASLAPTYAYQINGDEADFKLYDGVLSAQNRGIVETLVSAEYI